MYNFQERMAEGRAVAKRQQERLGSSPYECFANERQRFASMSEDDWRAREADEAAWANELGPAVDATGPVSQSAAATEKAKREKIMTATQYRAACKKLDISVYRSAQVLGIHLTTAQRYASGKQPIPRVVEIALRAMVRLGTTDI